MSKRFFSGVILACAACECGPKPECVSVEDCGGRSCIDGVCEARRDGGGLVVTAGGRAGGSADSGLGGSGGGSSDSGTLPPCAVRHTGTLSGVVTEPSGTLALPNVGVFVPTVPLDDFPEGPSGRCIGCEEDFSGWPLVSTITSATGTFTLDDVPAGLTRVVMQTGRWRREVQTTVIECTTTPMPRSLTRLPRSKAEGHLPKMALATGAADPLECLLLKLGIEPSEFTRPDGGGSIHLFVDNGQVMDGGLPSVFPFYASGGAPFDGYDAVLAPCRGGEFGANSNQRQVMASYVDRGGRFFTTHYGYEWMLSPPFSTTATWEPTAMFGMTDSANVVTSFPRGAIYRTWLTDVARLGSTILITDPRYNVGAVRGQTVEYLGAPFRRQATDAHWTAQLSFTTPIGADAGCGRVAFSDFHVSTNALQVPFFPECTTPPCPPRPPFPDNCVGGPFTDQEKVLVYILFDLGTCAHDDRGDVNACVGLDARCSPTRSCCGDLRCLGAGMSPCDAGACTCQP